MVGCIFTLQHVDTEVVLNMLDIINKTKAEPGTFARFSLILEVLMKYSECRDINRSLLSIFFDKKCFGKTNVVFTIMNGKRVKCYSSFCGHMKSRCASNSNNMILESCNYICKRIIEGKIDGLYSKISHKNHTIEIVFVEFTHIVAIKEEDDTENIVILIKDHNFAEYDDTNYNIIECVYQQREKLLDNSFVDKPLGYQLTNILVSKIMDSCKLLDKVRQSRNILDIWTGKRV